MTEFLSIYATRRMLIVLALGFASGLPLALTGGTFQAWLTDEGIDTKTIGLFSLIGLPYSWKVLWSPLMDRFVPPWLGRRRGWIFVCQLSLAAAVAFLAFCSPKEAPLFVAVVALVIAFLSASQDIVIDAYRTELLSPEERGPGASVGILGYRVAMLTSGALALILADLLSWQQVYLLMAALLICLSPLTFYYPEANEGVRPPRTLRDAVIDPLLNFFQRRRSAELLCFVILYKFGDVLAVALMTKFMMSLGFTKTDIGSVAKTLGLACSIAGSLLGGIGVMKWGLRRSLFIFGLLQGVSILTFAWLSVAGLNYPVMSLTIGVEAFCNGLGNAALVALLMALCDRRFTVTQYSLLTGAQSLARTLGGAMTGYLVTWIGWTEFFFLCTALSVPGLVILVNSYDKWDTSLPASEPS